jgi:signal transduction histidine kinase
MSDVADPVLASTTRDAPSRDVFAGGGEVAALMRGLDWAATPLGPVDTWPQSLKTTVSTCLNSRFPILVWWGRDLIKLYNDAYAPILGAKHPSALGRPGREVWAEIWDIIGPMLEGVIGRGEATWSNDQMLPLNRHGYVEECYFTFTYSPIRDETGGIGGVFCAVIETTERVVGARRLAALRELGNRSVVESKVPDDACRASAEVLAAYGADLPFALFYLIDEDGATARLAGASGMPAGKAASPLRIALGGGAEPWPVGEVAARGSAVEIGDVRERFGDIVGTTWPEPVARAVVLPLLRAGQDQRAWGVLVAGISPRRALDDEYRGFCELVAGQVATAVENGNAYAAEQRRAATLSELDRAKTVFFSNVSHEFRTPLSLLLGPTEELLGDTAHPLAAGQRAKLELVHRNALRLLALVNALLDFSRIEAGRADAAYERTDVPAFTADLVSTFHSAIDRAGLRLVVDCPPLPAGVEAYVDRGMWEKIVLNLVSNALKHTFDGEIGVRVAVAGNRLVLEVRDTGVGIPAEQMSRLFERFHRVPNARSRTHEGTGIGLALVQEMVLLHGGTVSVTSAEDRGTTFTVSVPLGAAHLAPEHVVRPVESGDRAREHARHEAERMVAPDVPIAERPRGARESRGRVLLADDNPDMREYVTRLLTDGGWEVAAVADGEAALRCARRDPPDLVLADVMMPGLDGFALLQALRADHATDAVPVILLSARAGEEARFEGLGAGADGYLVKPFTARELLAHVDAQVTLARARDRLRREIAAAGKRLSTIFAQAPVAIAVLRGPAHVFELANDAYRGMTGGRELLGKPIAVALPELAGQGVFELLDAVYASGQPHVGSEMRVLIDREGDGQPTEAFFNFVYQPMLDATGAPESIAVVAVDVTALVRSRREAETANRVKSDFLAAMSHELRTPLNAIGGYVDLMVLGVYGALSEAQRDALGRVKLNQQRLLALINDVLNFAKIEAGRLVYDLAPVSVSKTVQTVGAIIEPQLLAKGVHYDVRTDDSAVAVADEEKLQQILINLLTNAMKFTPAGGTVTVEVAGHAAPNDDRVVLRVRDTGIGIPPDKQESIFDPFVQVNRRLTTNSEGTGLGLAISRDLARGMGADLRVDSVEGQGATFSVALRPAKTA